MSVFTNIFSDSEIAARTPDCSGDYYFVSDRQADFNYNLGKTIDSLLFLSSDPTNDFQIINGGFISDNGDGTIDISECTAIGYDVNDNKRFISLPELTNIELPSGWDDGRQIWVTLKYDSKLGTETRTHKIGGTYHYQLEDTYLGDEDGIENGTTDDLFTDSDPTDTATILGSFTMTGTTYVDQNERSIDYHVINISAGQIVPYMANDDPAVYGDRIILLQGQVLEILPEYKPLIDKTYCGDGTNATAVAFFKTSDAGGTTRDTSGTYFVLPDTRGLSLKNIGNAVISGRTKIGPTERGEMQEDQGQDHEHNLLGGSTDAVDKYMRTSSSTSAKAPWAGTYSEHGGNGTPRMGANTRDSSIGTNFGITY